MRCARCRPTAFLPVLCTVASIALPRAPSAQPMQVLSDAALYDGARNAAAVKDYRAATAYIYAYIQRNDAAMQTDDDYRARVLTFYRAVWLRAAPEPAKAAAKAGEVLPFALPVFPTLPPRTTAPPARPGVPLVCRGGGGMHFAYSPYSGASGEPQIQIRFEPGTAAAGPNRENVAALGAGQCTWLERTLSRDEPNVVVLTAPLFAGRQFAIQWQRGQVTGIASELRAVNLLQRDSGVQTFHVYDDRKGSLVVTRVE